jgi:hypothetical protein
MLILVKAVIQNMRANAVKNSLGLGHILSVWGMLVDCRPEALPAVALCPQPSQPPHAWRTKGARNGTPQGHSVTHGSILGGNEYLEARSLLTSPNVLRYEGVSCPLN